MNPLLPDGIAPFVVPAWPVPPFVKSLFTLRHGGVSRAPFDSLNLGDHVGDAQDDVRRNREILQQHVLALSAASQRTVFLQQVHGCDVVALDGDTPDAAMADVALASQPGVVCTIMVADCLPVLLVHAKARVVAAAHAGWRGLAGHDGLGVLEAAFAAMAGAVRGKPGFQNSSTANIAQETMVWLGPCIGPEAFEVGRDVVDAFVRRPAVAGGPQAQSQPDEQAARCFKVLSEPDSKWLADLPALARLSLARLGITQVYGNDSSLPWCTFSNPHTYFSHRRDAARLGASGRLAACIWLDGPETA